MDQRRKAKLALGSLAWERGYLEIQRARVTYGLVDRSKLAGIGPARPPRRIDAKAERVEAAPRSSDRRGERQREVLLHCKRT